MRIFDLFSIHYSRVCRIFFHDRDLPFEAVNNGDSAPKGLVDTLLLAFPRAICLADGASAGSTISLALFKLFRLHQNESLGLYKTLSDFSWSFSIYTVFATTAIAALDPDSFTFTQATVYISVYISVFMANLPRAVAAFKECRGGG